VGKNGGKVRGERGALESLLGEPSAHRPLMPDKAMLSLRRNGESPRSIRLVQPSIPLIHIIRQIEKHA
jgi:hypothetical protein